MKKSGSMNKFGGMNRVGPSFAYPRVAVAAAILCFASGCGPAADDQADRASVGEASENPSTGIGNAQTPAGESNNRPIAFLQCVACHTITEDSGGKTGPSLLNIYDQKVGQVEGYNYSEAMAASDVVWDRQTLSDFLAAPNAVVPGTKMIFAGIKDEAKRAAIVDYLEEISSDSQ